MTGAAPQKPVTAVIVCYQSAKTIGRTLAAARRCHDAGLLDVVVVDNNSSDDTRAIIARAAGWARLVLSNRNQGFGRGCNLGFAQVASPYTIFINPDAIVEPDALRTMLHFMEQRPQAGIVGPATLCGEEGDTNLLVQHTGRLPTPWTLVRNALPFVGNSGMNWDVMPGSAPARTGWVCGAILMIRTDLMRRLDGFDARFFLYWEETDLCRRAELSGFENWVVGDAVARHVVAASSGHDALRVGASLARHFYQSRFYYLVKHHGWLAAVAAELGEFALLLVRTLADVVRGRGTARLRARLQAVPLSMPARVSDEH